MNGAVQCCKVFTCRVKVLAYNNVKYMYVVARFFEENEAFRLDIAWVCFEA